MTTLNDTLVDITVAVVTRAGGTVTFDEYDRLMAAEKFFLPMDWGAVGWGLPLAQRRANVAKLAVFEAVKRQRLEAIEGGYKLP